MRNLKRILSLAMASIMLVGMMVVGASAADFPDSDKIENTDAVNILVSLGIIKGKDDGNFDPEGIVTRAEMAKMICVALNKGKDPNLSGGGMYPDTVGHWASGYIDYCANLKIVAGDNNGKFNPNNTVTGVEAAKMILIAIGYDAEAENFVNNAKWDLNISARASERGLMEDLSISIKDGLTRDNAAQMIYNGLKATMVEYDYKLNTENGDLVTKAIAQDKVDKAGNDVTLMSSKFDLQDDTGFLVDINYNSDNKEYTYEVEDKIESGASVVTFTSKEDYTALYGMKVNALYKVASNGDVTGYGMYEKSKAVSTTTKAEVSDVVVGKDTFKINGTKYTLEKKAEATPVYVAPNAAKYDTTNYFLSDVMGDAKTSDASTLIFVSSDSNTKFDYAVLIPATVAKVTFVSKDSITAGGSFKFEDDVIADGIEKNDYVKIVAKANSFTDQNTVTKLEVVSGTVNSTRTNESKVDGTWYNNADGLDALEIGADYDLYVIGSYIYAAKKTSDSATMKDVILVTESDGPRYGAAEAKVYFTDGTSQIVKITKLDNSDVSAAVPDGLYTYKIKSGNYEVTAVDSKNTAGADGHNANAGNYASKKIGTYYIADDAAVFVKNEDTDTNKITYKFFTGAQAKKWGTVANQGTNVILYSSVNGLRTAQAAFINLSGSGSKMPTATGSTKYGFVTSDPETVKIDDETYFSYTVWTENGSVDVLDETARLQASKGDVISYEDLGDSHIGTVSNITSSDIVALTGVHGDDLAIRLPSGKASAVVKKDKDTVILYVNSADDEGVTGGELDVATEQPDGSYITNAWVVADDTNKDTAAVIVYDVNNDVDNFDNDASNGFAGYTIAVPTIATTPAGWTISADKTKACEGDIVTITLKTDGTGTQTTATFSTVTGASAPTAISGMKASTAGTYTAEIVVGASAISEITVTLS